MMTIMPRKAAEFWWNEFAKQQGREPFVVPPEVACYYKNHQDEKWEVETWQDIFAKRKKKQDQSVYFKINDGTTHIKPAFIWVFYNDPKIFPFYTGWYIYLKTTDNDYALNFTRSTVSGYKCEEMIHRIMQRYPCGVIPAPEHFEMWANAFEKTYHRESKRKKRNALLKCHIKIDGFGNLEDLILD